ncbi:MAG: hypothetical protein B6D58_03005 [candidate division Zixibacteria bacterium 4484_95]|nr:MAG: hypothetical protein B6D58_03005 [candidate division Zixibacteria bacterium 4484_95]
MLKVNYLLLTMKTDREVKLGVSPLSLQVTSEYQKLLNQSGYTPSGGNYPLIQYKVIRGAPIIVAVNEGCDVLWNIYDCLDEINERSTWEITEKRIIDKKVNLGPTDKWVRYRFLTPWLTIPAEELGKKTQNNLQQKNKILTPVLENNFLGIARNFDIPVEDEININLNVRDNFIIQKDTGVAGFFGTFYANFELPPFLGLGRSISRGFGTIKHN